MIRRVAPIAELGVQQLRNSLVVAEVEHDDGPVSGHLTAGQVKSRLRSAFAWRGDRTDEQHYADMTGWWRQPDLLQDLGPALALLFEGMRPTVVLGLESRGCLLGPLVALTMGVGFVEVRKDHGASCDSDAWLRRTTPPDYRDRHLVLGFRRNLLDSRDRVVLVDDWVDTGGQAQGVHSLVQDAKATWLGVAAVVDALAGNEVRRRLNVRSLLHVREL